MIRSLIISVLMLMAVGHECSAGYSIITDAQRQEFVQVNGPYGVETYPASAAAPPVPAMGSEVCRPGNYSIFAADPARRTRVFRDVAGTATSAELFAACPQIRTIKGAEIRAEGDRRLNALASPYLPTERVTWPVQMQEAAAWQADHAAATPMLNEIAAGRGISVADLVAKVLENTNLFRVASGTILGQQQFLLDWIDREPDFGTLVGIGWEP